MSDPADVVTVERVIRAPAERIFELLADPTKHHEFDGSDSVHSSRPGNPARLSQGAKFTMSMRAVVPYRMTNEVVEFEEGHFIAWWNKGKNVWSYERVPLEDGSTLVRETFDATEGRGTGVLRAMGTFDKVRRGMEQTLERLAWLIERR